MTVLNLVYGLIRGKRLRIVLGFLSGASVLLALSYNIFGSSLIVGEKIYANHVPWNYNLLWDPLPKQNKSLHQNIKLYIIEEHHEALSIWFDAYHNKTVIPAVSILHIDAHDDFAVPVFPEDPTYPMFQLPKTKEEIILMIQNNDDFIVSAVNTGFVRDYIWIYPDWLSTSEEISEVLHYGYTDNAQKRYACMCIRINENGQVRCFIPPERESVSKKEKDIFYKLCNIKAKVSTFKTSDAQFLNFTFSSPDWVDTINDIILDIDLDFFGVHLIGHQLIEVGILRHHVDSLNYILSQFCITNGSEESMMNSAWSSIISLLLADCVGTSACTIQNYRKYKSLNRNLSRILPFCQLSNIEEKFLSPVFEQNCLMILNHLIQTLRFFKVDQLSLLQKIGICQETTLMEGHMVHPIICVGKNFPSHPSDRPLDAFVLLEHLPSESELKIRLDRLEAILRKLGDRPVLITLCRSGRDGYTPRHLLSRLERDVVDLLTRVYELKPSDVHRHPLLWHVPLI